MRLANKRVCSCFRDELLGREGTGLAGYIYDDFRAVVMHAFFHATLCVCVCMYMHIYILYMYTVSICFFFPLVLMSFNLNFSITFENEPIRCFLSVLIS